VLAGHGVTPHAIALTQAARGMVSGTRPVLLEALRERGYPGPATIGAEVMQRLARGVLREDAALRAAPHAYQDFEAALR